MKNSILALSLVMASFSAAAQNEPGNFTQHWRIAVGATASDLNDFSYNDINIDAKYDILSDSLFSASLQYHFTPQWAISLQATPDVGDCSWFCSTHSTNQRNQLVDMNYRVDFYHLEAIYNYPVSQRWSILFSGGATIGREKFDVRVCEQYNSGFFGRYCDDEGTQHARKESDTKYGVIGGIAMNVQFNQRWGLQFGVKASNYREGLTQGTVAMTFSF